MSGARASAPSQCRHHQMRLTVGLA